MIWFVIGFILGANISLFLYAILLAGKREDEAMERGQHKWIH